MIWLRSSYKVTVEDLLQTCQGKKARKPMFRRHAPVELTHVQEGRSQEEAARRRPNAETGLMAPGKPAALLWHARGQRLKQELLGHTARTAGAKEEGREQGGGHAAFLWKWPWSPACFLATSFPAGAGPRPPFRSTRPERFGRGVLPASACVPEAEGV